MVNALLHVSMEFEELRCALCVNSFSLFFFFQWFRWVILYILKLILMNHWILRFKGCIFYFWNKYIWGFLSQIWMHDFLQKKSKLFMIFPTVSIEIGWHPTRSLIYFENIQTASQWKIGIIVAPSFNLHAVTTHAKGFHIQNTSNPLQLISKTSRRPLQKSWLLRNYFGNNRTHIQLYYFAWYFNFNFF